MIIKSLLQSVITKYHLGGLVNSVKWRVKDDVLTVYGSKDSFVCKIVFDDFKVGGVEGEMGIFDTDRLKKLLVVGGEDLEIRFEERNNIYSKMFITNEKYKITYTLADIMAISKVMYVKDLEKYDIEIIMDSINVNDLIKAKNSLGDNSNMMVKACKDSEVEFIFGDNTTYSNKVSYKLLPEYVLEKLEMSFNSDIFREILSANKDSHLTNMKISNQGLMKLNFKVDNIKSEYFIVRNQ